MYSPIYYCPCCKHIHTSIGVTLEITLTAPHMSEYTDEIGTVRYRGYIDIEKPSTYDNLQIHNKTIHKCSIATCKKDRDVIPIYIDQFLFKKLNKLKLAWVDLKIQHIVEYEEHIAEESKVAVASILLEEQNK